MGTYIDKHRSVVEETDAKYTSIERFCIIPSYLDHYEKKTASFFQFFSPLFVDMTYIKKPVHIISLFCISNL